MKGRRPAPIDAPSHADLGDQDLDGIAGRYLVGAVSVVTMKAHKGHAAIRIKNGIEYPAFRAGDGQLYGPGLDVWIGFPRPSLRAFQRLAWFSIFHVVEGAGVP